MRLPQGPVPLDPNPSREQHLASLDDMLANPYLNRHQRLELRQKAALAAASSGSKDPADAKTQLQARLQTVNAQLASGRYNRKQGVELRSEKARLEAQLGVPPRMHSTDGQ